MTSNIIFFFQSFDSLPQKSSKTLTLIYKSRVQSTIFLNLNIINHISKTGLHQDSIQCRPEKTIQYSTSPHYSLNFQTTSIPHPYAPSLSRSSLFHILAQFVLLQEYQFLCYVFSKAFYNSYSSCLFLNVASPFSIRSILASFNTPIYLTKKLIMSSHFSLSAIQLSLLLHTHFFLSFVYTVPYTHLF